MTERVIEVVGVEKAYRFFRLASVSLEGASRPVKSWASSVRTAPAST